MPRVSVIIPACDAAGTIARTIESVRRQTFDDFEILVVDDGSTDDTVARVRAIGDPRIKLCSYANGGLATARNRGIAEARGEFLAFLDADDLWGRGKLASHVAALTRRTEAGAAYSWSCTIDEEDRVLGRHQTALFEGDVHAELLRVFFIGNASNAILRREVVDSVGPYDAGLDRGEDWEFLVRVASRWPFVVVPEYQVFYRQRAGSISSNVDRMRDGLLIACEKMFGDVPARLQSLKPDSLAHINLYIARCYLTRTADPGAVDRAASSLVAAFALRPGMFFNCTAFRLCCRWLLARAVSVRAAETASRLFHEAWSHSAPEVDPWG